MEIQSNSWRFEMAFCWTVISVSWLCDLQFSTGKLGLRCLEYIHVNYRPRGTVFYVKN